MFSTLLSLVQQNNVAWRGGGGIGPHSNGFLLQTNTTTQQCSPQHDRAHVGGGVSSCSGPGALSAVVSVVRLVLARFYPEFYQESS